MLRDTSIMEKKWHEALGKTISLEAWDKLWKMLKNPLTSNKQKWIQLQINRFSLPTNYSVNKYKAEQSPWCSFCRCNTHTERIPNLFWNCPVVKNFWVFIETFLQNFHPSFTLGMKEAILGDIRYELNSSINTILVWSREFIWKSKFGARKLDEIDYLKFIKGEYDNMILCLKLKNVPLENICSWASLITFFE